MKGHCLPGNIMPNLAKERREEKLFQADRTVLKSEQRFKKRKRADRLWRAFKFSNLDVSPSSKQCWVELISIVEMLLNSQVKYVTFSDSKSEKWAPSTFLVICGKEHSGWSVELWRLLYFLSSNSPLVPFWFIYVFQSLVSSVSGSHWTHLTFCKVLTRLSLWVW